MKYVGWIFRMNADPGYLPTWGYSLRYAPDGERRLDTPVTCSNLSAQEAVDQVELYFGKEIKLHETANLEIGLRVSL